ncbi:MAG: LarC family nickel insertion protein [Chloroflexi bacterium]|nr:MAG: LarC family nickel insertion protein [Chloroflexota bacterium]
MLLAALLDAGASLGAVRSALAACDLVELSLQTEEVTRSGLRGLHLRVDGGSRSGEGDLAGRLAALADAPLPARVRDRAAAVLGSIAAAEGRLHGVPAGALHLDELDSTDTIVDVVGVCAALEDLDVDSIWCSPLPAGSGSLAGDRGRLPLPAPATLELLAGTEALLLPAPGQVEHVTPTAAALLATLARFEVPAMRLHAVGCGAGTRDDPRRPNLVRAWLGDPAGGGENDAGARFDDDCVELRTNLDDVSPAVVAALAGRCLEAGALDVWVVAATMKKGRPGHVLHALVPRGGDAALAALLLEESPTLGVRRTEAARMVAAREVLDFDSPLGPVRVKCKRWRGRLVDARPELDDCGRLATATGRPLHEVVDTVTAAARAAFVEASAAQPATAREI